MFMAIETHATWEYAVDGSIYYSSFASAEYHYRYCLGLEKIRAFNLQGVREASGLEGLIKRSLPSEAMNMIEAFLTVVEGEPKSDCQHELNRLLASYQQPWRLLDGRFVKLDSAFLASEVITPTRSLLASEGFDGPLQEFEKALTAHSNGEYRDSIIYAGNAFESTLKAILDIQHAKPGELIRFIIDSGLIPDHQGAFLSTVESLLSMVVKERSQPGHAHGQGRSIVETDPSVAELCLHLTGTVVVFLIKRHREKTEMLSDKAAVNADDLPF